MADFLQSYGIWILLGLPFLLAFFFMPCHAPLLLPVLALPIFWLLPLGYALPIYAVIVLISACLYWLITRVMRKPVTDGFRSLIGTQAEVVSKSETGRSVKYLIRAQGELWSAYSTDSLEVSEQVNIVAVKGIGVVVKRTENGSGAGEVGNMKTITSGVKNH